MRLNFKRNGQSVSDVDDPGIFFAGAHQNFGRFGRKHFEERPGVFVRAVLAPHHREDAQLGVIGFTAQNALDPIKFLDRESVLPDEIRSDGGFGYLHFKSVPLHAALAAGLFSQ
jgi:hypothetical protein